MSNDIYKTSFLQAADDWVCDSYAIDIRCLVRKDAKHSYLYEAAISLHPLPAPQDMSFRIDTSLLFAGQFQLFGQSKQKLLQVLDKATRGQVDVHGHTFKLSSEQPFDWSCPDKPDTLKFYKRSPR